MKPVIIQFNILYRQVANVGYSTKLFERRNQYPVRFSRAFGYIVTLVYTSFQKFDVVFGMIEVLQESIHFFKFKRFLLSY